MDMYTKLFRWWPIISDGKQYLAVQWTAICLILKASPASSKTAFRDHVGVQLANTQESTRPMSRDECHGILICTVLCSG